VPADWHHVASALAVALDSGNADDLAGEHIEREAIEEHSAVARGSGVDETENGCSVARQAGGARRCGSPRPASGRRGLHRPRQ
jgi:hypothetical protein